MYTNKRKKIVSDVNKGLLDFKGFMLNNYKTILKVFISIFVLYWMIFILTPSVKMSSELKQKIDVLDKHIDSLEIEQKKIDEDIRIFNESVINIDKKISNIKQEKTIIKEIYHEKITAVDNYTSDELDSFFAKRYGYTR